MLDGGQCPNWLCHDPRRSISRIRAIAYSSGALKERICNYKYDGKVGWSLIFGRLVLAWMERHGGDDPPDLIVANPTFSAEGTPRLGHTERVLHDAAAEDVLGRWPFDVAEPPVVVKTAATRKSAGKTASVKRVAAAELRAALTITDRSRIEGKRILVYDDVCTTGSQLNAVANCLMHDGGALSVDGLVLARQPWRPRALG